MTCTYYLRDRARFREPSAGGVPAFGKWNEWPGARVVVGGFRRLIGGLRLGQEVLLRSRLDGRSHGIQQSIEFNFAHRALRVGVRNVSEVFCLQIEQIAQIVSIRRSRTAWLPMS